MKRIFLFVLTNLAVMVVLGITASLLGVNRYLTANGLNMGALMARDWRRLFVTLRPLWAQARLELFGHALLEKLATPYKGITAHVYAVPVPVDLPTDADWDAWLATSLSAEHLHLKPYTPLPVLGTPGWCSGQDQAFYADAEVFRAPRRPPVQIASPHAAGA